MSRMDNKLKLTINWREIYEAIEENGFVVFPKDALQKFAQERAEWEIKNRMMDSWMADRAEQEAEHKGCEWCKEWWKMDGELTNHHAFMEEAKLINDWSYCPICGRKLEANK